MRGAPERVKRKRYNSYISYLDGDDSDADCSSSSASDVQEGSAKKYATEPVSMLYLEACEWLTSYKIYMRVWNLKFRSQGSHGVKSSMLSLWLQYSTAEWRIRVPNYCNSLWSLIVQQRRLQLRSISKVICRSIVLRCRCVIENWKWIPTRLQHF